MQILGIDPGLHITGYAVINTGGPRPQLREAGVLRMTRTGELAVRIAELHRQMTQLLEEFQFDHVAVEQLYAHYKHPRTAILMGHARGVILLAAAQSGVPVTHLSSTLVKKTITGNGHAGKAQVQRTVAGLCRLAKPPSPPDVADAIAIGWVMALRLRSPVSRK
jgi:crossover junction endodeoxyribonuclease RuvC